MVVMAVTSCDSLNVGHAHSCDVWFLVPAGPHFADIPGSTEY